MVLRRLNESVVPALLTFALAAPATPAVEAETWPMDFGVRVESFAISKAAPPGPAPGALDRLGIAIFADVGDAEAKATKAAPRKPFHPAVMVLIVEAVIVANAGLATLSPDAYGGLALVLAPFTGALCEPCNKAEAIVGGVGLGGIGAYNILLDTDDLSSGDVFTRNLVAWHVVAAAMGITYAASRHRAGPATGETPDSPKGAGAWRVYPVRRGVGLGYTYTY